MIDTKTAAQRLGVCAQRVSKLAAEGRIPGAKKFAGVWTYPNQPTVTPGKRGPKPAREAQEK